MSANKILAKKKPRKKLMTNGKTATELRECPFCGGEAYYYAPGPIEHHIACKNYEECGADIKHDTEAEVIAAWNTRATLKGEKPYYTDRDDNGNHITCTQCGGYLGTAEEFAAMAGEKRCFATDYTHEHCKYSVNRGWTEDTKFYIPTVRHGAVTVEGGRY